MWKENRVYRGELGEKGIYKIKSDLDLISELGENGIYKIKSDLELISSQIACPLSRESLEKKN